MNEALKKYLSDKRTFDYRGKAYYTLKNYKHKFFLPKETVEQLTSGHTKVLLEQNQKLKKPLTGLAKWDNNRKRIMISESNIKVNFQPFDVI